jgi:hypothetical protein
MKTQRILPLAAWMAAALPVCFAQTPVSVNGVSSTAGEVPANIYTLDVNNDGITDIVQDTAQSPSGLTVSVGEGNGMFYPPTTTTLPGNNTGANCIAPHDFNNDGNVDLAIPLVGTNQIAVYLGNGDTSFQAPTITTVQLPSGYTFTTAGCAAADFNGDGSVDLVAWTYNSSGNGNAELYAFAGQGDGTFNASPHALLSGGSGPLQPDMQVFVGDYDDDNKADIAAVTFVEGANGSVSASTINVLYGNNDFTFDNTTPYTYNGFMTIGSGDINSDGVSDLFALAGSNGNQKQLGVLYGVTSRTFDDYWIDTDQSYIAGAAPDGWYWQSQFAMADYNGDGHLDLAVVAFYNNNGTNEPYVDFFLSEGGRGQFTSSLLYGLPPAGNVTTPVAGLFGDTYLSPDMLVDESTGGKTPSSLETLLNDDHNYFGPCKFPKASEGFDVCAAGTPNGSANNFNAAVNSFGNLRFIALWVDGKKAEEQHFAWGSHAYFKWTGAFSAGTHSATYVAGDIDHKEQKWSFTFTAQ